MLPQGALSVGYRGQRLLHYAYMGVMAQSVPADMNVSLDNPQNYSSNSAENLTAFTTAPSETPSLLVFPASEQEVACDTASQGSVYSTSRFFDFDLALKVFTDQNWMIQNADLVQAYLLSVLVLSSCSSDNSSNARSGPAMNSNIRGVAVISIDIVDGCLSVVEKRANDVCVRIRATARIFLSDDAITNPDSLEGKINTSFDQVNSSPRFSLDGQVFYIFGKVHTLASFPSDSPSSIPSETPSRQLSETSSSHPSDSPLSAPLEPSSEEPSTVPRIPPSPSTLVPSGAPSGQPPTLGPSSEEPSTVPSIPPSPFTLVPSGAPSGQPSSTPNVLSLVPSGPLRDQSPTTPNNSLPRASPVGQDSADGDTEDLQPSAANQLTNKTPRSFSPAGIFILSLSLIVLVALLSSLFLLYFRRRRNYLEGGKYTLNNNEENEATNASFPFDDTRLPSVWSLSSEDADVCSPSSMIQTVYPPRPKSDLDS